MTVEAVKRKLVALEPFKGSEPDGITLGVLEFCHLELAAQLRDLFNLSLSLCVQLCCQLYLNRNLSLY